MCNAEQLAGDSGTLYRPSRSLIARLRGIPQLPVDNWECTSNRKVEVSVGLRRFPFRLVIARSSLHREGSNAQVRGEIFGLVARPRDSITY
jgi:hypothetical protein